MDDNTLKYLEEIEIPFEELLDYNTDGLGWKTYFPNKACYVDRIQSGILTVEGIAFSLDKEEYEEYLQDNKLKKTKLGRLIYE